MITARGGCHLQGGYSAPIAFCAGYGEFPGVKSEGAALVARNAAYHNTAYDVLGVCAFGGFSITLDEYANMLNDVTGLDMKASDLETVSRRVLTLERLFNLLCGFTPEDDWLPERFYLDPIAVEEGAAVCPEADFRAMRAEYYESLGWDERIGAELPDEAGHGRERAHEPRRGVVLLRGQMRKVRGMRRLSQGSLSSIRGNGAHCP